MSYIWQNLILDNLWVVWFVIGFVVLALFVGRAIDK